MYDPLTVARFWSKVEVREKHECWPWKGAVGGAGKTNQYGRFKVRAGSGWDTPNAHRVAWEIFNLEPLGKRFACHTCDNTLCVNPHHLYAGDRESNTRDGVERKRFKGRGSKTLGSPDLQELRKAAADDTKELEPSKS